MKKAKKDIGKVKVFLANSVIGWHLAVIVALLVALTLVCSCNLKKKVERVQKQADTAVNIASAVSDETTACTESLEGRVSQLEDTEIAVTDQKLQRQIVALKARQDQRVKKENAEYMEWLGYIRRVNPSFALCSRSDAEIRTLLNNGVWDVESQIQLEYDRLVAEEAKQADVKAEAALQTAEVGQKTAKRALIAAEVGLSVVKIIAKEPEVAVSPATKKSISAQVAAYYKEYGDK